jgi:hypothetical protein
MTPPDAQSVAFEQTCLFGLAQGLFDARERLAGTHGKQSSVEAVAQTQGVHQELARQVGLVGLGLGGGGGFLGHGAIGSE